MHRLVNIAATVVARSGLEVSQLAALQPVPTPTTELVSDDEFAPKSCMLSTNVMIFTCIEDLILLNAIISNQSRVNTKLGSRSQVT
jgi:hypothetical protein